MTSKLYPRHFLSSFRARSLFLLLLLSFLILPTQLQSQTPDLPVFRGLWVQQNSSRAQVLQEQFESVEVYRFPSSQLEAALRHPAYGGEVMLSLGGRHAWHLWLEAHDIRTEDYRLLLQSQGGPQTLTAGPVITYRGGIVGKGNSEVRLTLQGDFLYGYIAEGDTAWFVEPLRRFDPQAPSDHYTLYASEDVKPGAPMGCGVSDMAQQRNQGTPSLGDIPPVNEMGVCRKAELAIACDFSMLVKHGDVGSLVAYTLGVMNNVGGDYMGSFNDDIEFEVAIHYLSTCSDCDYLTTSTNASNLLSSFVGWGNAGNFGKPYDLAQFWTDRDLDGSTIGIAYLGVVCTSFRYHVLQDFRSTNASLTRVLVSHEIGHNFNASHDPSGSPTIMAPAVNNTSAWSSNSISSISTHISTRTCLGLCSPAACPEVTGLQIANRSATSITLNWNANSANSYRVRLRPEGASTWSLSQNTNQTSYTLGNLSPCTFYEVQVSSACNGNYGPEYTLYFTTSKLELISATPYNCQNGAYDLEIRVSHGGGSGNFELVIDGKIFPVAYGSSPQSVKLPRIFPNNGRTQVPVILREPGNSTGPCFDQLYYDAPGPRCACSPIFREDFNSLCSLPVGWSSTSTNTSALASQYKWQFDDASRYVVNLPNGTIDGTCMAYFDDDINSNTAFSGVITLTSPPVDLTGYEEISLSFDYDFFAFTSAKGTNSSFFRVEVWDGANWQTVLQESGTENCSWSTFWNCPPPRFSVNIDNFKSSAFQVRFVYGDGNAWAGAVGVDNVEICGYTQFTPPSDLPVAAGIYIADREGSTADGWTHYWKQAATAPVTPTDVLLLSIRKNGDASLIVAPSDVKVGVTGQGGFVDLGYFSGNAAPYVDSSKNWFVMNRYWDVTPFTQPTGAVEVRYYYRHEDFTGLQDAVSSAGDVLPNHEDLELYKFTSGSGVDPDPMVRPVPHSGGNASNFQLLSFTHHSFYSDHYAEFSVNGFSGGSAGSSRGNSQSSFPLEVIRFEGWQEHHNIRLEWTTIDEANSGHFDVERSVDGEFFSKIGEVISLGANSAGNDYSFLDKNPLSGRAYYRLRQVELNGEVEYSPVLTVTFSLEQDGLVQIFPNPMEKEITILLENSVSQEASCVLYDRAGRELLRKSWQFQLSSREKLDVSALLPGLYIYQVRVGDRIYHGKLLKL